MVPSWVATGMGMSSARSVETSRIAIHSSVARVMIRQTPAAAYHTQP